MIVQYNGKNYSGFEVQKNAHTIQGELNHALNLATKQQISTTASGRTDAGVSAYFQPVHFDIQTKINTNTLLRSLNGILPNDIKVLSISPTNINACTSAKKKTYIYKMYISNISLPLYQDALQISPNLNFKSMKSFCSLLKGKHDFAGFQASGAQTKTTVRTIYSIKLKKQGMHLTLSVTGNGFLYKMVRNIVGTMLKVGEGKINLSSLKKNLFTTYKSVYTAKPEFLYLANVKY